MRSLPEQSVSTCLIFCGIAVLTLGSPGSALAILPALIQRQTAEIQDAWREIDQVLRENEKLVPPLAEPYLARGDLWTHVGGYEDALADYLKGTEIFFQGNPTPGEQARHLARIRMSLQLVVTQPRPHYPADAATEFDQGMSAFRIGDFSSANACFVDCTRLMPDEPIYRIYRSLTHYVLQQDDEASRQVGIASSLIRANTSDTTEQMRLINRSLEPVQGPLRFWLVKELGSERSLRSTKDGLPNPAPLKPVEKTIFHRRN